MEEDKNSNDLSYEHADRILKYLKGKSSGEDNHI